jgi:Protein of unknown function (DUF3311)
MVRRSVSKQRRWFSLVLLAIPLIALLWPSFYNGYDPSLFGIPFFYWYQMAWIILTALLIMVVYFLEV